LFDFIPFKILLKKMCFQRKVKNQPIEISIQPVVLHLVYFGKKIRKSLALVDIVVKPIQSIVSCFQLIGV